MRELIVGNYKITHDGGNNWIIQEGGVVGKVLDRAGNLKNPDTAGAFKWGPEKYYGNFGHVLAKMADMDLAANDRDALNALRSAHDLICRTIEAWRAGA